MILYSTSNVSFGSSFCIHSRSFNSPEYPTESQRPYHGSMQTNCLLYTSTYRFIVRGHRQPIEEYHPQVKHYLALNKGNVVQEPGMELVIPRGMLYEDVAPVSYTHLDVYKRQV